MAFCIIFSQNLVFYDFINNFSFFFFNLSSMISKRSYNPVCPLLAGQYHFFAPKQRGYLKNLLKIGISWENIILHTY